MNIVITGHARHGKDTVCEYLRDNHGLSFVSYSRICLKKVVFPVLRKRYGYRSLDDCYADRVNHR